MTNATKSLIDFLRRANQLKMVTRTGWLQRGIPQAESVAAHSYGVTFIALILARISGLILDEGKLLAMAVLHDLPESLTGDIPTPSWRYLPKGSKPAIENAAMEEILATGNMLEQLLPLWLELAAGDSLEAQVVQDADKIDMILQALIYQEQFGNQRLGEFWDQERSFHLQASQRIYDELVRQRRSLRDSP